MRILLFLVVRREADLPTCLKPPMVVTLMGACVFRVAWVWWILPLDRRMETLFISYPVSWILVTGVNGLIFYVVLRRLFRQAAHHAPESSPRHFTLRP